MKKKNYQLYNLNFFPLKIICDYQKHNKCLQFGLFTEKLKKKNQTLTYYTRPYNRVDNIKNGSRLTTSFPFVLMFRNQGFSVISMALFQYIKMRLNTDLGQKTGKF